ncbi:MAG: type 4 pilus major pilin [Gammaproteobacteria bacterium]
MFTSMPSEQKGISLLELMLALVVISALLLLATRYYQQTRENLRVAQAIEMTNNVVNASYKWLEGQPSFSGISIPTLISSQFLSKSYDGNSNPWKGTIAVGPATDTSYIVVTLTNIPSKSCQNLKEKMLNRALKTSDNRDMPNVKQPNCIGTSSVQQFEMSF